MTTLQLTEDDVMPYGRKEFAYRCPHCGDTFYSNVHLEDSICKTTLIWPETTGYKKLMRAKNAREADLKAKQRNALIPEHIKEVLDMAREGQPNPAIIFIATFLDTKDKERKLQGYATPTEMDIVTGNPPEVVLQYCREFYEAGERGRGLIKHLCNRLNKSGGSQRVIKPKTDVGEWL